MFPDDKSMSIGCWDSRTTEKLKSLHSGKYQSGSKDCLQRIYFLHNLVNCLLPPLGKVQ